MTADEVRRIIEQRLIDAGRDSSPEAIDRFIEALRAADDPDLARGVLDGSIQSIPSWIPDEDTGVVRRLRDLGIALNRGALAVAQTPLTVADMITAGHATPLFERLADIDFGEAQRILDERQSNAAKREARALAESEGVEGAMRTAVDNPMLLASGAVESLPAMLAGGVVGRGVVGLTGMAPRLAGPVGEGAISGALTAGELAEDGLSLGDVGAALASGAGTALIGRAGQGLARYVGAADPEPMLAGGIQAGAGSIRDPLARVAISAGIEAGEEVGQSAQEAAAANLAAGRPIGEGVAQSAVVGGMIGAGMGALSGIPELAATPRGEPAQRLLQAPIMPLSPPADDPLARLPGPVVDVTPAAPAPSEPPPPSEEPDRLQAIRDAAARAEGAQQAPKPASERDRLRGLLDVVEEQIAELHEEKETAELGTEREIDQRIEELETERDDLYKQLDALTVTPTERPTDDSTRPAPPTSEQPETVPAAPTGAAPKLWDRAQPPGDVRKPWFAEGAPESEDRPTAAIEKNIREVYERLNAGRTLRSGDDGGRMGDNVELADLRRELDDFPREQVDAALIQLARDRDANFMIHEDRRRIKDRAAQLMLGGTAMDMISMRLPEPSGSAPSSEGKKPEAPYQEPEGATNWRGGRDAWKNKRWRKLADGRVEAEKMLTGERRRFPDITAAHNWLINFGGPVGGEPSPRAKPQKTYEYSSTQVNIPSPAADYVRDAQATIREEDLTDEGLEDEPHITVLYGLHTADPEDVRRIVESSPPVEVVLGEVSTFPDRGDGVVLKVDVDSPDLRALHKRLADELEYTSDFPDYNPHMTLAYVQPGTEDRYTGRDVDLTDMRLTLDRLKFSGKDGRSVEIELKGKRGETKPAKPETKPPDREPSPPKPETKPATEETPPPKPKKKRRTGKNLAPEPIEEYTPPRARRLAGVAEAAKKRRKKGQPDEMIGVEIDGDPWFSNFKAMFRGPVPTGFKATEHDVKPFTNLIGIVMKREHAEVYPVAYSRADGVDLIHFDAPGVAMLARNYDFLTREYGPELEFRFDSKGQNQPIIVRRRDDRELQALVMPTGEDGVEDQRLQSLRDRFKPPKETLPEPKGAPTPRDVAKLLEEFAEFGTTDRPLTALFGPGTATNARNELARREVADALETADSKGMLPAGVRLIRASTATRGPEKNLFRATSGQIFYAVGRTGEKGSTETPTAARSTPISKSTLDAVRAKLATIRSSLPHQRKALARAQIEGGRAISTNPNLPVRWVASVEGGQPLDVGGVRRAVEWRGAWKAIANGIDPEQVRIFDLGASAATAASAEAAGAKKVDEIEESDVDAVLDAAFDEPTSPPVTEPTEPVDTLDLDTFLDAAQWDADWKGVVTVPGGRLGSGGYDTAGAFTVGLLRFAEDTYSRDLTGAEKEEITRRAAARWNELKPKTKRTRRGAGGRRKPAAPKKRVKKFAAEEWKGAESALDSLSKLGSDPRFAADDDVRGLVEVRDADGKWRVISDEEFAALRRRVETVAARIVPGVETKLIEEEGVAVPGAPVNWAPGLHAVGTYHRGIVQIALRAQNPENTLRHEALHALYDMGFITPEEWSTLQGAARRSNWAGIHGVKERYGKASWIEEGIAHEFADWQRQQAAARPRDEDSLVDRVFKRIARFLNSLREFLFGERGPAGFSERSKRGKLVLGRRGRAALAPSAVRPSPPSRARRKPTGWPSRTSWRRGGTPTKPARRSGRSSRRSATCWLARLDGIATRRRSCCASSW